VRHLIEFSPVGFIIWFYFRVVRLFLFNKLKWILYDLSSMSFPFQLPSFAFSYFLKYFFLNFHMTFFLLYLIIYIKQWKHVGVCMIFPPVTCSQTNHILEHFTALILITCFVEWYICLLIIMYELRRMLSYNRYIFPCYTFGSQITRRKASCIIYLI